MIATGLLWYDDDTRRPLAVKIAEATQRFRERVGYEPTTCQLHPALAEQATSDRERPKRQSRKTPEIPAPDLSVRLEPNDTLRPNYFFVGVEAGDKLKRVRGWLAPDVIEAEPRRRSTKARSALTAAAKQSVPAVAPVKTARTTRQPAATASPVAAKLAPVAAKAASKAAKTVTPPAATTNPKLKKSESAPKVMAQVPSTQARKIKNPATPATEPAPATQRTAQPAPRPRAATTTRRPAQVVAAPAAQSSLWGDMPAAVPSRKRRSA